MVWESVGYVFKVLRWLQAAYKADAEIAFTNVIRQVFENTKTPWYMK